MPTKFKLAYTLLAGGIAALVMIMIRVFVQSTRYKLDEYPENPATDYEQAMARMALVIANEENMPELNPVCRSKVLTHGKKTERVIVFVHGMTNCPAQFNALAPLFYNQGYNVLVPRIPHNGYSDPDTRALKDLTAEQLRDHCSEMVDVARGLGEQVTYAGISAGGTMAAWVAQNRHVAKAVLIAPAFTISRGMHVPLSRFFMYLLLLMPNVMTQRFRPFTGAVGHNYHGFATRGLGQLMRLGFSVYNTAKKTRPAAQSVLLITNAGDPAVENSITYALAERWKAKGLERLDICELDASYRLIHDIIDPNQKLQQTALVYPVLLDWISRPVEVETFTSGIR